MAERVTVQDMSKSQSEGLRPDREQVFEFLKTQVLGTLATLDADGHPQVATVAFSSTPELRFIIGTAEDSRKATNVAGDDRVAFVVTDPEQRYTVQLEGVARRLTDQEFEEHFADEHYRQRPQSLPFKDEPGQCHILVEPTDLRFSDCNPHPWVLTEFDFDKDESS
jgi:general stress protein 26